MVLLPYKQQRRLKFKRAVIRRVVLAGGALLSLASLGDAFDVINFGRNTAPLVQVMQNNNKKQETQNTQTQEQKDEREGNKSFAERLRESVIKFLDAWEETEDIRDLIQECRDLCNEIEEDLRRKYEARMKQMVNEPPPDPPPPPPPPEPKPKESVPPYPRPACDILGYFEDFLSGLPPVTPALKPSKPKPTPPPTPAPEPKPTQPSEPKPNELVLSPLLKTKRSGQGYLGQ